MSREEDVYLTTLNLLGSDFEPPEIQEILDREHGLADPAWLKAKKEREKAKAEAVNLAP